ncbi:hypothetical protein ACWC09_45995 [Streptomyces sp. NPDC001617]
MSQFTFTADDSVLEAVMDEQASAGTTLVIGSMVNAAGLVLGKSIPLARLAAFHRSGLGSAPVWNVFTIDGGIAFTPDISPVGDLRLRLDIAGLRRLGGGVAWGPASLFSQDGLPVASCARGTLARIEAELAADDYSALVGHELEFVLVHPDGRPLTSGWTPYGITGLLDRQAFLSDLYAAAELAGVSLEQVHAEYGPHQFEFSLPPASPVAAADTLCLAKVIVGRVAREHGLAASFSPAPFPGTVGNGAHQHISLLRSGTPVFAGGDGLRGLTPEGESAIGGLVRGLPEIQGFLTGSVLSGKRLGPGSWSGAYACWGTENREAAVRFLAAGPANPHGANVEVKIVDPSANVYLASAAILALAHDGIRTRSPLPGEVTDDPGRLTEAGREEAGIHILSADPKEVIDRLDTSHLARRLLGDDNVNATVACRRYEQSAFGEVDTDTLAHRFRLAWSV